MNKTQIIKLLASRCGITEILANKVLTEFLDITSEVIANGEKLQLVNFGSLSISNRKERLARNPKTNQPLIVPEHKSVKFSPGKALKEKLNPNGIKIEAIETIETINQPVLIL